MVMNLFSVFDPVTLMFQMNWVSLIVVMLFVPNSFYVLRGGMSGMVYWLWVSAESSLSEIVVPFGKGVVWLGLAIFMYFMMNNVMGLFSFVFVGTAHPMVTISIGLTYWVAFVMMGWFKNFKISVGHLVPQGSPLGLAPVLAMIELISHLIRPFTLSIRLAANMMAGHLIVGLLSSISLMSGVSFVASILLQGTMLVLEFAVALIQGLVFGILVLLYVVEYY